MNRLFMGMMLILGIMITGPAAAREVIPAPPPGEETSILAADHAIPFTGKTLSPDRDRLRPETGDIPDRLKAALTDKVLFDDLGGDDMTIFLGEDMGYCSIDIASNGDIYAAVGYSFDPIGRIEVYRSRTRGALWSLWGEFIGTGFTDKVHQPHLIIAEGVVDRCFLAYRSGPTYDWDIVVAHSPLDSYPGEWTEIVALPAGSSSYQRPRLATDASNYADYFVYLVAEGDDGNGGDIWFTRSIDQGNTYETPYQIGTISIADREYASPEISYGLGGHIHVAWHLTSDVDAVETVVRYRRAQHWGNMGLGSWGDIEAITGLDGVHEHTPLIAASTVSSEVVMTYGRIDYSSGDDIVQRPRVLHSTDDGLTFGTHTTIPEGMFARSTLEQNPDDGSWIMGGSWSHQPGLQRATAADPLTWSDFEGFADSFYPETISVGQPVALDPSDGYRPAMIWSTWGNNYQGALYFDAEWRRDPGYPNLEYGFPLELTAAPISHPAVVDLFGVGLQQIVFSDAANRIQVINYNGSSPPGWPQDVGVALSDGPVAVGDLDGDDNLEVVVGGTDGKAYAYDHQGNLLPGWPSVITPPGYSIYVSIGAVGGPYHRSVICAGADIIVLRSHHGEAPPGTYGRAFPGNTFEYPAAVGDIDDDGVAEIVGGLGTKMFAYQKGVPGLEFSIDLPSALSDALTMGDLDLDGDLEILCPTISGELYALDHTGSQLGGHFPYDVGASLPLTSAAIAQFRGTSEPDIAFAHLDFVLQALYHDGEVMPGWPRYTSILAAVEAAPIVGGIDGNAGDVAVADWLGLAWGFSNFGDLIGGWPRDLNGNVTACMAMGDIDLDESNEMVMLTDTQLFVVDLNVTPGWPLYTWPMYGHDPARTGCADCPEDLVTPVDPGLPGGGVTRVSFAGASPNPLSGGGTQFSFAVPLRSAVSLEILDLRGARVYTVYREETEAGPRVVTWNGRDATGRPVASGTYFARLRVRGPGLNQDLTRKLMVVK